MLVYTCLKAGIFCSSIWSEDYTLRPLLCFAAKGRAEDAKEIRISIEILIRAKDFEYNKDNIGISA
jgi:hypothetical protein